MQGEKQKIFKPLNIVYKLVMKIDQMENCYFSQSMKQAYCVLGNRGKRSMESATDEECFGCNKFFIQKTSLENHKKIAVQCQA